MKIVGFRASALSIALALLPGCGILQPTVLPSSGSQAPSAAQRSTSAGSYLYVGGCCPVLSHGGITVYNPGLSGVDRRIFRDANSAYDIAFDTTGRLYVVDWWGEVVEFDRGSQRRSRRLGLYGAWAVALDSANNLYVDVCPSCVPTLRRSKGPQPDEVNVYQAGTTKLLRSITRGVHSERALAFDSAGNLYVANANGKKPSVTVYAPGSGSILRKMTERLVNPVAIAVDRADDVFVMNWHPSIIEYAPHSTKVLRRITNSISSPQAIALDASGTLYVANSGTYPDPGWISVYAPGSAVPEYKITQGINDPIAVVFDSGGNLYVASNHYGAPGSRGHITVYAPGAQTPFASVRADKYGNPISLAVGPQ
jgi:DNA-binding beta-propeller fold protein YncE